jgi:TPP-dependent pyruvate/acetoin dehydrogenase alpha subunit
MHLIKEAKPEAKSSKRTNMLMMRKYKAEDMLETFQEIRNFESRRKRTYRQGKSKLRIIS